MVALEFRGSFETRWLCLGHNMTIQKEQMDLPPRLVAEFERQRIQFVGVVCIVGGNFFRQVKIDIKHGGPCPKYTHRTKINICQ